MELNLTGDWWQAGVALGLFLLAHRWPTRPANRLLLVATLGEPLFTVIYSLLSLLLMAWLISATLAAPVVVVWYYAPWQAWTVLIVMLPVCLLTATALGSPNPLSFGGANNDKFQSTMPGSAGVCRHPLLLALALWAVAHVLPNGEVATLLLFLPLALFSLFGMRLVDRRRQAALGQVLWQDLAAQTSLLPGQALLAGRWRPSLRRAPWGRLALGIILYLALILAHPWVIGVPAGPVSFDSIAENHPSMHFHMPKEPPADHT